MENQPWMKMYFLLNMEDFPASHSLVFRGVTPTLCTIEVSVFSTPKRPTNAVFFFVKFRRICPIDISIKLEFPLYNLMICKETSGDKHIEKKWPFWIVVAVVDYQRTIRCTPKSAPHKLPTKKGLNNGISHRGPTLVGALWSWWFATPGSW